MATEEQRAYGRAYQRALRKRRREAGLCIVCEKPSKDTARCDDCGRKDNEKQAARRKKLVASGLCPGCGEKKPEVGHLYCPDCLARAKVANVKRNAKCRKERLCLSCGQACERRRCDNCNVRSNAAIKKVRLNWVSLGKCRDCGGEAILTTRSRKGEERARYCKTCYLKVLSRHLLGSGLKWELLVAKLNLRDWRCVYTGDKLVLGDNLSFDHLDPVSRFPEKKHDLENIEPCTWQVNLLKRDLTKKEFMEMTEKVYLHSKRTD